MALRADLLRRLRRFFDDRGFLEIDTPLLSADTVIDRHLDPFPVTLFDDPRSPAVGRTMWLQTSPEFAMKRLLAAGGEKIYQVTKAFRAGERGALHNPEFTIAEWYRAGDSMDDGIELLAEFTSEMLDVETVERMSYGEAFQQHAGLDPHRAPAGDLERAARALGVAAPAGAATFDRDDWLHLLLALHVEPRLGHHRPLILYDYPASQAALARTRHDRGPVAERFELYVGGMELANGYHELLDIAVLRERNRTANRQRLLDGKYRLPEESRLLAAMEHGLPPCSGVALGFDRLVMIAAGAKDIREVLPFPIERA